MTNEHFINSILLIVDILFTVLSFCTFSLNIFLLQLFSKNYSKNSQFISERILKFLNNFNFIVPITFELYCRKVKHTKKRVI